MFGIFPIGKKNLSNQKMNVVLYTMKIYNFNTKKCANLVILTSLDNTTFEIGLKWNKNSKQ